MPVSTARYRSTDVRVSFACYVKYCRPLSTNSLFGDRLSPTVSFAAAAAPAAPEPFYNYWNYTSDIKDMNVSLILNTNANSVQV